VVGEYLDAGADDEHHKEHIQEVLRAKPPGETGVYRRRGLRDPGVAYHERLDGWDLQQTLRQSNCDNEGGKAQRQRP